MYLRGVDFNLSIFENNVLGSILTITVRYCSEGILNLSAPIKLANMRLGGRPLFSGKIRCKKKFTYFPNLNE